MIYAVDSGHAVNPLTIAEQLEGGTIFGLTAALYGKITVKNGAIEQGNFDTHTRWCGWPRRRGSRSISP